MKILFSINSMNCGGAERVVSILANTFVDNNIDTAIVVHDWPKSFYRLDERVNYINIRPSKSRIQFTHRIISLRKEIQKYEPDVVISFIADHNIVSCISNIGLKSKVIVCERNDPRKRPQRKLMRWIRNICYYLADGYVFQTEEERQYFKNKRILNDSIIILNPIDIEKLPDISDWPREKKIAVIGRLTEQKRVENIIYAFSDPDVKDSGFELYILGEGDLSDKLKKISDELNISDKVHFIGRIDNVTEYIKKMQIYIMASDFEGMPNALIEAMSMGLACIATDCPVGGPKALVQSGRNGILIPVANVDALRNELLGLINSPEKCRTLGEAAIEVRRTTSVQTIYKQWVSYIKKVTRC